MEIPEIFILPGCLAENRQVYLLLFPKGSLGLSASILSVHALMRAFIPGGTPLSLM